jgi:hypothetical protein
MQEPADSVDTMATGALREGMAGWALVDAPWLPGIEPSHFARTLDAVRDLDPAHILSSHLPPASGVCERLLANLAAARERPPFRGPDQRALEEMTAGGGALARAGAGHI